jgi:glucokinase
MKKIIAVDIGGTSIRAALFEKGHSLPLDQKKIPTQGENQSPEFRLCSLVQQVWPQTEGIAAISIAAPGNVIPDSGSIDFASNIPSWTHFPLRQYVQDHFHVPVLVENDANLAAYGEWKYGAGIGHRNLIYITISTGIGSGIIIEEKIVTGVTGGAGELGHITMQADGPVCSCGMRGHLEAFASGTAIEKYVEQELLAGRPSLLSAAHPPSALEIEFAARKEDKLALEAYQRAGYSLGRAIADLLAILNPSLVILGGGVSLSGALIIDPIWESLRAHVLSEKYLENFSIVPAKLGDQAGLLGAFAFAEDR